MVPASGAIPERTGDVAPHEGGAALHKVGELAAACTSAFTVIREAVVGDQRAMLTAGHCFDNGDNINSTAGDFGIGQAETAGLLDHDMILVDGQGELHDDDIYTNRRLNGVGAWDPIQNRDVQNRFNAVVGNKVCVSGQVSGARCNLDVTDLDGTVCHPNDLLDEGCTFGLITSRLTNSDIPVSQGGDSGAPIYRCLGPLVGDVRVPNGTTCTGDGDGTQAGTVEIAGMNVGRNTFFPFNRSLGEPINKIECHLRVSVATSPTGAIFSAPNC